MGHIMPERGRKHRMVIELEGGKNITQEKYEEYKKAVMAVAKAYGAKVAKREYVIMEKKAAR